MDIRTPRAPPATAVRQLGAQPVARRLVAQAPYRDSRRHPARDQAHCRHPVRHDDRRPPLHDHRQPRTGSPLRYLPTPTARRRGSGSSDRPSRRGQSRCALLLPGSSRGDAAFADDGVAAERKMSVLVEAFRLRHLLDGCAAPDGAAPNAMFSAMVALKRNGSCGTKPIAPRTAASGRWRTSMPSTNTVPGGGSWSRGSRFSSVDFPACDADDGGRSAGRYQWRRRADDAYRFTRRSGCGTRRRRESAYISMRR